MVITYGNSLLFYKKAGSLTNALAISIVGIHYKNARFGNLYNISKGFFFPFNERNRGTVRSNRIRSYIISGHSLQGSTLPV